MPALSACALSVPHSVSQSECVIIILIPRFLKIRLGLYSKKFQKCFINYLGLSLEQTVTSQLYLLVKHCIFIIEIVVVYHDLYDIHEKFEYSCDVTNKAHPHPLLACLLCLKRPTFLY